MFSAILKEKRRKGERIGCINLSFWMTEDYMREFFPPLVDWAAYGFEIIDTFSNGEDALQFLRQHPVDLVISDIKMGRFSGLDFCRELRKFDDEVTIVLLSGYQDFEDARRQLRYNVFDYLLKPVSFSMLDNLFSCTEKTPGRKRNASIGIRQL